LPWAGRTGTFWAGPSGSRTDRDREDGRGGCWRSFRVSQGLCRSSVLQPQKTGEHDIRHPPYYTWAPPTRGGPWVRKAAGDGGLPQCGGSDQCCGKRPSKGIERVGTNSGGTRRGAGDPGRAPEGLMGSGTRLQNSIQTSTTACDSKKGGNVMRLVTTGDHLLAFSVSSRAWGGKGLNHAGRLRRAKETA